MLRISLQTLRARRGTLAGAFVAIWLAVTLAYGTGLLMDGALGPPGPGRFTTADAVVRADPSIRIAVDESIDAVPGPGLDAALVDRVAAVPGVTRATGDVSFPLGAWEGARHVGSRGHAWSGAGLRAGRAPAAPREVAVAGDAPLGARVRVTTPAGEATYRVTGLADGPSALYFEAPTARRLSGTPGVVNAIAIQGRVTPAALRAALPPRVEVLDRDHAAEADAGDPGSADRASLVAIFGTMGGIAGAVALFVVAGTFSLAIVQRRREVAVLRALGAAPHQVRRLIAGEALIVSLAAGALGLLAGRPLAGAIVGLLGDHDVVPPGFHAGDSWIPLVAALGGGVLIAQFAVFAAARRAGRTRPAEALRDAAIEHHRPGVLQIVTGVASLAGGVAMALVFSGTMAVAFAILAGMLLAAGVGLLGRLLLGFPAALLARPLRGFGASGLLASTSLSANRWRTAALATPIVLVAMLAGTQAVVQSSGQRDTERVTEARTLAPYVVVGRDGAPLPAATVKRITEGADGSAAVAPTSIYPDGALGEDSPWAAAGVRARGAATLDLRFTAGSLQAVRRDDVAVSRVFAGKGGLRVGERFGVRMADTTHRSLRVAAIYERAAGLGDVIVDRPPAPATAIFVAGPRPAPPGDGVAVLTRAEYRDGLRATGNEQAWAVWMIIGLAALFTALALINTAAMATSERRGELATIRLLGGTAGQAVRTVALETLPTILVALGAGAAVVAVSVYGVPRGLTGVPLSVPVPLVAAITAAAATLGLIAALVSTRLALRTSAAEAMRTRDI